LHQGVSMIVGTLRIVIFLHDCHSLKQKRGVVKRILERTRSRFNVSAAEVGANDIHGRGELAFVMVGNDSRYINGALDKMINFIDELFLAEIIDHEIELIHL